MREEKGSDKYENSPSPLPPLHDFKPDDPPGLLNELGQHKQQVKEENRRQRTLK